MSLKHTDNNEQNKKGKHTCLWWTNITVERGDRGARTFGPSDDVDALSSGDPGLDVGRAVGSWYFQVWTVRRKCKLIHSSSNYQPSERRRGLAGIAGRFKYQWWWRSSAQTRRPFADSWRGSLRGLRRSCLWGQRLQTPDVAALELESTAQVGRWPVASLQREEAGAWEQVFLVRAI